MLAGFDPEDARLADRLRALAHPARLRIIDVLAARGSCVCGQIVEVLPLAQATVSQHLKVLKEAGFLKGTIEGPRSCYCLDDAALARFRHVLDARLAGLDPSRRARPQPEAETVR